MTLIYLIKYSIIIIIIIKLLKDLVSGELGEQWKTMENSHAATDEKVAKDIYK